MLEKLKKIFEKMMPDVDLTNVDENTKLIEDLKFDSLGIMMLAMAVEDEFGFKFDEIVYFQTVGDVIKYIEEQNQ